jgi:hypothetical protein
VLTVNGSGFVSGAVVKWNGVALATTFVNQDQLTARVPAIRIAKAGTAYISVANPSPGGTSNIVPFNITQPISSLSWKTVNTAVSPFAGAGLTADFNGDGIPDLVLPGPLTGKTATISILLGLGNGTFVPKSQITSAAVSFPRMTVGDFNQDGKMDLVVFSFESGNCFGPCAEIFLGNGDGTFTFGYGNDGDGGDFLSLAVGDFNGDGTPDIAVGENPGGGPPEVLVYGIGANGALSISGGVETQAYAQGFGLATGDFNGDGILDMAVSGQTCLESCTTLYPLAIFLGDGQGNFLPASSQPPMNVGGEQVMAADFDGDGILDLALAGGTNLEILHGNGDGTFTQIQGEPPALGSVTTAVDLNADGKLDILATSGSNVYVYFGNGDGSFNKAVMVMGPSGSDFMSVADFNRDGKPDLIFAGPNSSVTVLLQAALPIASFNQSVLVFGNETVNVTSAPLALTLLNSGGGSLDIANISILGPNFGDFTQSNDCGKILIAGSSCNFEITFTPLAVAPRNAQLRILDNATKSSQTVGLYGVGVAGH